MQDVYIEIYKTLLKGTKDHLKMERYTRFIDWKTIFKILILSKLIYRFHATAIKSTAALLEETADSILKFIWKCKRHKRYDTLENF